MRKESGYTQKMPEGKKERKKKRRTHVITQSKIYKWYGQIVKRYLKLSVNVTQLCNSPLKLVHLHGNLKVLGSHQRGVRAAGHMILWTDSQYSNILCVSYLWMGEHYWFPVRSGHWFYSQLLKVIFGQWSTSSWRKAILAMRLWFSLSWKEENKKNQSIATTQTPAHSYIFYSIIFWQLDLNVRKKVYLKWYCKICERLCCWIILPFY